MFVDSHCHLDCIDLTEFNNSFSGLIKTITDAGIVNMLCVSIDLEKYPGMLELVKPWPQISVSVGVHPMADQAACLDPEKLLDLGQHEKVVAIGETGLDYYYHKGDTSWQQQRFRTHVQSAVELNKPLIIHTRDAGQDTLDILKSENATQCKGVIHCFTENMAFAEQAMALGFMISFSGIITFHNAKELRQIAAIIPDEFLLIETDSPYLAPAPHRGKQNHPGLVSHVAEKLAHIRNTSVENIAEITSNNYHRLFMEDKQ